MTIDIFDFWSKIGPSAKIHPNDREVFQRFGKKHGFDHQCLPHSFAGPLRKAKIVLLYLSPGLDDFDLEEAKTQKGRKRMMENRSGNQELPGPDEHKPAWRWWKSRTKDFGNWEELRSKVAVLNIGAYHSKQFDDYPLLAALPSSRVSLEWAQTVLFPQAEAGDRVVICLRAAHFWGLDEGSDGKQYGKSLFAPRVTRGGHMMNKPPKNKIIKAVEAILTKC